MTEKTSSPADGNSSFVSKALQAGASITQSFDPVKNICQHLCGIHFYADDMSRQVVAHHYCTQMSEDMYQCIIFDSDEPNAKLIGIEYVVSEAVFKTLPEEEKRFWHSHRFEVGSGLLTLPTIVSSGVESKMETKALKNLLNSYGKTVHTWQVDRGDQLPLGPPQMMMAFTEEGQVNPSLTKQLEQKYSISYESKKKDREELRQEASPPDPAADSWQSGKAYQIKVEGVDFKR
ncbi:DUF1264-domain-containing protein [Basidiobolus meristosporus CBS 931.73]|uniref:DUF1264-domain-containing protein n=1 Tax=Basidiobolus meristosporus CBS 931.73 TaxID=1314790 RepID=A0A1Y1Z4G5_9FUNG|nr:DUF1264-domain-containing protein [Basidiobolus meristosporus CBS 931.73]|eukprot:ORY05004.1 DUF1264-domain-containing protein [Basidiobolus meristosporus CBS 931.73]